MTNSSRYLIAVDGGGTGCRVVVADRAGKKIAAAEGGPANLSTDYKNSRANIIEAIDRAWSAAGLSNLLWPEQCCVLGLAGVNIGEFGINLKRDLGLKKAIVTDDRETTLHGVLGDGDGCVAALGTGSFYSSRDNGKEIHIGGWGLYVGDDGSGALLGQNLLRCVIHCHDGLKTHSVLTRSVLSDFNNSPAEIATFAEAAGPRDYGKFVPFIIDSAREGDPLALKLVEKTVKSIQASLDAVGFTAEKKLYLLGGLGSVIHEFMPPVYANAKAIQQGDALSGALGMAMKLACPE